MLRLEDLEKIRTEPGGYSGEQTIYRCPFCPSIVGTPDPTGNLAYDAGLDVAKCWRCGTVDQVEHKYGIPRRQTGEPPRWKSEGTDLKPFKPPSLGPLSPEAEKYLFLRGFNHGDILSYGIRETRGNGWDLDGRVYVPVFGPKGLETYVTRVYTPDREPRYRSGPNGGKQGCLFRAGPSRQTRIFVIVEGVFDALKVGQIAPCVALLGKELHPAQMGRILEETSPESHLITLLDPEEAEGAAKKVTDQLRPYRIIHSLSHRLLKDPGATTVWELDDILSIHGGMA